LLAGAAFVALTLAPRIVELTVPTPVMSAANELTARASAALIACAGIPSSNVGSRVLLTNHVLRIDSACNGFVWLVLYALSVLLVPVSVRRKLQGLLIGWPILIVFNFARIVVVAAVSQWRPGQFLFVHDVVLQLSVVVVAMTTWGVWMWVARNDWKPGWQ
jgi:exosortase/archaeosortase family protein